MRIAVIGPPWVPVPPPAYGGTEAVLDGLVRGLVAAGHEVAFAGHPDSGLPVPLLGALPVEDIGEVGQTACELAHVALAYERAAAWGAEVIHDHTVLGSLVGDPKVPVVVTNHGRFDSLSTPIFERIARRSAVVAVSHAQAASAPSVPITSVVHHGLDTSTWPCGDGRGDHVAFLGRMHPDKGPHRAIHLARQAGVPLVIAAKMREPAEVAFFNEVVRPLLHGDVHFVGEADASAKRALLAGARALLNPISWPEPFGMVMVEALACGTPVIAAPLGAAPEIVEPGVNGFLCTSAAEFVEAIDATRRLDRAACRTTVATRFTVEQMVDGYLAVFDDLRVRGDRLRGLRRVSRAPRPATRPVRRAG